ncbi:enoyl-CoA hydratase [Marinicauda pacifica]|uniref:Enoyl-CoA hydratase n=1 Tax=Marinicauda pacifica TaxID=1133559 RepID=A0A4S2HA26_9PROT|nr:enoyl-CoA hydratase-related protein [Marinicauda pacifica]TGY92411.1 enoyl-CoA hydratase [Marinicauda pacifica]GGE48683.1 enoyl-CoA hydratase [Marinicauda pacifica]
MSGAVRIDARGPVAILTLDRPARGNAIDAEMADAILDAALTVGSDDAVRAVVLTGAGKVFCVGGDVTAFGEAADRSPALVRRLTASLHMAVARLARMDKPLVTAINGAAAGAGFGLSLWGDAALAARSAQFTTAYGAIGLTPDAGASWLLPRLVGLRQAQRLALMNERITAGQAEAIGLVTRVVEDAALMDEALAAADQLARGPRQAFAATRDLLLQASASTLESHLEAEARFIARAAGSAEGLEGVRAFIERREADFAGL